MRQRWIWLGLLALSAATAQADRLLLQVEHFEGPWRRQTNIPGYLGAGFCTSNANPKVASTVMRTTAQLEEPGRYVVWVRAFSSANSRRALQAEVNGTRLALGRGIAAKIRVEVDGALQPLVRRPPEAEAEQQ